ncbi:hypothetical protein D0T53_02350 [Dysgonomonas sp. 216]|uniref:fasciclin domain-containing protein n=1 Tax=Dysgonomonas sp. 216 TaxID=2302934 RepID=UPI0013CFF9AC|nr:fasciclin domain-containing protein [Dysgonomonas sp. 216]NDW17756.1 hypothetical protein [Dysgonomonas sp. 216]
MNKFSLSLISLICICLFSCNDEYYYENNIPETLGKSIYDYLESDGHFKTYVRLIDDLEYSEVLARTGSKTLFVADDEAFERFYANNEWGVRRYEDLSLAQKKVILNSSMINNALLIEGLSTLEGPVKGQVLRRSTAIEVSDSIPFVGGSNLPENKYWNRFRSSGVHLAKDGTATPMLHFVKGQMLAHNITKEDFTILMNGIDAGKDDAYIYDVKVKKRDVICQNGYVHVLDDVLLPPSNMAEELNNLPETRIFSSLLERYAVPYYSESLTSQHHLLGGADSVFIKGYLSKRTADDANRIKIKDNVVSVLDPSDPNREKTVPSFLEYDPGWNRYTASTSVGTYQTDMAAVFAPSDDALIRYFEGLGRPLLERYGSIDNIPDGVIEELVKNHMQSSFLAALPSNFMNITDDAQEKMGVEKSHVDKVHLSTNGVIYVTNVVYPPALYSSVMLPAEINENMKVFKWAISTLSFKPYLLSMVNYYSFFIPTDNFTYIVPNSLVSANPFAYKFHYNDVKNDVYASVHYYNLTTHEVGDSIGAVSSSTLRSHLEDMLNYHIIVGNIEDGRDYYRTKGGGTIKVARSSNDIIVAGGGDIERDNTITVEDIYDQTKETNGKGNGKTYVIDEPLQTPTKSVYKILSNEPKFEKFFKLLEGRDDLWLGDSKRSAKYSIFYKDVSQAGLDYNVRFLNTFHYTLYVPTNEAVQNALDAGLPSWDDVEAETDQDKRDALAEKIIRFLRYHFQDNAVFLDKVGVSASYETATLDKNTDTFYKLTLNGGNYALNIQTESGGSTSVKTDESLFNIMGRDFKFNTANPVTSSSIVTSSYIVIHQINDCLYYENNQFND